MTPLLAAAIVTLLSAAVTAAVRAAAVRFRLYDEPNDRSAHTVPTPRLGGVALSLSALAGWAVLIAGDAARESWHLALLGGGAITFAVGLVDDLRGLSPAPKFAGELAAIAVPVAVLMSSGLSLYAGLIAAGFVASYTNFFNFMDGSDGLAGGVAVLTAAGLVLLASDMSAQGTMWLAVMVAAAAAGFLLHNFPPASIFMGDSGSLFLGYALATLAVAVGVSGVHWSAPMLVLSPFLFDAVFTLGARASRREVLWRAHMSHLYQRLLRSGVGARRVAVIYYGWTIVSIALALAAKGAGGRWAVGLAAAGLLPGVLLIIQVQRRERVAQEARRSHAV